MEESEVDYDEDGTVMAMVLFFVTYN